MSNIIPLSPANKPSRYRAESPLGYYRFSGIERRLLNPEPLLPAARSRNGKTATHACPWCGKRHRHHVKPDRVIYTKLSHCAVFHRLFQPVSHLFCVRFYIAAEVTESQAWKYFHRKEVQVMLAEYQHMIAAACPLFRSGCHNTPKHLNLMDRPPPGSLGYLL